MSRNDDRPIGGDETQRLNRTGRGAKVTGVHGVDAVDVEADQEIPVGRGKDQRKTENEKRKRTVDRRNAE